MQKNNKIMILTVFILLLSLVSFTMFGLTGNTVSSQEGCYVDLAGCPEGQKGNLWKGQTRLEGVISEASFSTSRGLEQSCHVLFTQGFSQDWPLTSPISVWWCGTARYGASSPAVPSPQTLTPACSLVLGDATLDGIVTQADLTAVSEAVSLGRSVLGNCRKVSTGNLVIREDMDMNNFLDNGDVKTLENLLTTQSLPTSVVPPAETIASSLVGDVDRNGILSQEDSYAFLRLLQTSSFLDDSYDFDSNGVVDTLDYVALAELVTPLGLVEDSSTTLGILSDLDLSSFPLFLNEEGTRIMVGTRAGASDISAARVLQAYLEESLGLFVPITRGDSLST